MKGYLVVSHLARKNHAPTIKLYYFLRWESAKRITHHGGLILSIIQRECSKPGEPLDIFKDWLFVALAMSQRTWLSFIIATLAALVLVFSSFWMRQHHCAALEEMLQPVSHAFRRRQQETFLAKQTAPSKLAVATQKSSTSNAAIVVVTIYGGSNTQFVFIGISLAKIATSATTKVLRFLCLLISAELWNVRKITVYPKQLW